MKEEFTTKMHDDMLGWSKEDSLLIDVYTEILRGVKVRDACRKYGISEEKYEANIEAAKKRCFS